MFQSVLHLSSAEYIYAHRIYAFGFGHFYERPRSWKPNNTRAVSTDSSRHERTRRIGRRTRRVGRGRDSWLREELKGGSVRSAVSRLCTFCVSVHDAYSRKAFARSDYRVKFFANGE